MSTRHITFSEVRSALMYGGQDYYTLDGAELTYEFSVGWESDGTHDGIGYYMYQGRYKDRDIGS